MQNQRNQPTTSQGSQNGKGKSIPKMLDNSELLINETKTLKFKKKYEFLNFVAVLERVLQTAKPKGTDFRTVGIAKFLSLEFNDSEFDKTGLTLLRNFGEGEITLENLDALLKYAGNRRSKVKHRRGEIDPEWKFNKEQLKEILKSENVNYHAIQPPEFIRLFFESSIFRGNGKQLFEELELPITKQSLNTLLEYAGQERFNSKNKEHLRGILNSNPIINYQTITLEEFKKVKFRSKFFTGNGETLLIAVSRRCTERTLKKLLKFTGIVTERKKYRKRKTQIQKKIKKEILRELLDDQLQTLADKHDTTYSLIDLGQFKNLEFNTEIYSGKGHSLLKRFGSGEATLNDLDLMIKFAGYERLDIKDKKQLERVLGSLSGNNYQKIKASKFLKLKFKMELFHGFGITLVKRYCGKTDKKSVKEFLEYVGYLQVTQSDTPEKTVKSKNAVVFDINNPKHTREMAEIVTDMDLSEIPEELLQKIQAETKKYVGELNKLVEIKDEPIDEMDREVSKPIVAVETPQKIEKKESPQPVVKPITINKLIVPQRKKEFIRSEGFPISIIMENTGKIREKSPKKKHKRTPVHPQTKISNGSTPEIKPEVKIKEKTTEEKFEKAVFRLGSGSVRGEGVRSPVKLVTENLESLIEDKDKRKEILRQYLDGSSKDLKIGASKLFAEDRDEDAIPRLQELAIYDTQSEVRNSAVFSLDEFKNAASTLALIKIMKKTHNEDIRWAVASRLTQHEESLVIDKVEPLLNDRVGSIRWVALWIVSKFKLSEIIPTVEKMAEKDPYIEVRRQAKELLMQRL